MGRGVLLVLLLIGPLAVTAQQSIDSLRSFYIQEYPNDFFIWPVIKYRSLSFDIRDKDDDRDKISFKPNNSASFGVGLYLFEVGIEITFAIPLGEEKKQIFGNSDVRDLQLNILTKSWGVDLYNQKYSGFYKDDSRVDIPKGSPYPQRPDVNTRNFGISGFYVLNNQRFSLRSSYNYAERQLSSKGSFIVYGTVNSFKLRADSAILSLPTRVGLGAGSDFRNLRYTTFSIAPGYSYNFIYKKMFVNGTLTVGPAHHWVNYQKDSGTERSEINFNATYSLRLAVGYNSDRFFGGMGFAVQSRVVVLEDINFENASNTVRILVGYRFKEKGLLEKRIWDFIPQLNKG